MLQIADLVRRRKLKLDNVGRKTEKIERGVKRRGIETQREWGVEKER